MRRSVRGIVFRQTKTMGGRRMVLLFTRELGKISAGAWPPKKGKNGNSLALSPFALGTYELQETRSTYSVVSAETEASFYALGEDPGRYAAASYVLELTDRLTTEDLPAPALFDLLEELLGMLLRRQDRFWTLLLAYQVKALESLGVAPSFGACASCGKTEGLTGFSVPAGGMICADCRRKQQVVMPGRLIYDADFGMIDTIKFFSTHPLSSLEKIALQPEPERRIRKILKEYIGYHLDIGTLRSEGMLDSLSIT